MDRGRVTMSEHTNLKLELLKWIRDTVDGECTVIPLENFADERGYALHRVVSTAEEIGHPPLECGTTMRAPWVANGQWKTLEEMIEPYEHE